MKWHGSRIALLVTDLVMPDGLGGVELAARLRQEKPALRVMLTSGYANETIGQEFRPPASMHLASAMQGDREKCLAVGMNDYVSKPVRLGELQAALERWQSSQIPVA